MLYKPPVLSNNEEEKYNIICLEGLSCIFHLFSMMTKIASKGKYNTTFFFKIIKIIDYY